MDDLDIVQLISRLMDIFEKTRLTKHIREITMHTMLRIIKTERFNRHFTKGSFLTLLVATAGNRNLSQDINKTAFEMLSILAKIPDISQYLLQDDDYHRLNIRGFSRVPVTTVPQPKTFSALTANPNSPVTSGGRPSNPNIQGDVVLPDISKPRRPSLRSNSFNRTRDLGTYNYHNSSLRMDKMDDSPMLRANNFGLRQDERVFEDNYFVNKNASYMSDYAPGKFAS